MSSDDEPFPSDYIERIDKLDKEIVQRMESSHGDPDALLEGYQSKRQQTL